MKYEREKEEASATTKLTYLLIGGGIGAVLGLLFAPKAGDELRGDIADATRKGLEKGKDAAALVGEKAGDYYEVTRDKAGELYQTAQAKAGDLAGRAGELTDKARDAVSGSNPLSAAIAAGRKAYSDEKQRTNDEPAILPNRPASPAENKSLNAPKEMAAKKDETSTRKDDVSAKKDDTPAKKQSE
jgi:gas vesicle protein